MIAVAGCAADQRLFCVRQCYGSDVGLTVAKRIGAEMGGNCCSGEQPDESDCSEHRISALGAHWVQQTWHDHSSVRCAGAGRTSDLG